MSLNTSQARAWVETQVLSDQIEIDLERSGEAVVHHSILLRIRGGPIKVWSLKGIDVDAVGIQGGTVVLTKDGQAVGAPYALTLSAADGTINAEVQYEKGLRGGRYLYEFSYRTNLLAQDRITRHENQAELAWVAPVFPDGLDGVQVKFRLPRSAIAPHLPGSDSRDEARILAESDGVFLSELLRSPDADTLIVTRPHVAKGEPVTWKVVFGLSSLDQVPMVKSSTGEDKELPLLHSDKQRYVPISAKKIFIYGGLVAAFLVLLLGAKLFSIKQLCAARNAEARSLIPISHLLRLLLVAAGGAGAVLSAMLWGQVLLAIALSLCVMALTSFRAPKLLPVSRGPGKWKTVSSDTIRAISKARRPKALAYLDASTLRGSLAFVSLVCLGSTLALRLSEENTALAGIVVSCITMAVPIFFTSKASDLPPDVVLEAGRWLPRIARVLESKNIAYRMLARVTDQSGEVDECRIEVLPEPRPSGLAGLEVALEIQSSGSGSVIYPLVLVRAVLKSAALAAIPASAFTSRGRDEEERVAILRPRFPEMSMLCEMICVTVNSLKGVTSSRSPKAAQTTSA